MAPENDKGTRLPVQGLSLGRFVLLEPIGAGSMGYVFAAYDPELDRKVAIKLLRSGASPEEGARLLAESTIDSRDWCRAEAETAAAAPQAELDGRQQRLLREAQAMAQLYHPGVVTVYEVGTHGRDVFIAMQYIAGQTLRSWQSTARRSWREVLAVYRQAGAGLWAAHQQGLIHRDFKPDNVMVDEEDRAYVLDFGLVRSSEEQARRELKDGAARLKGAGTHPAAGALGTPAYMSPEQLHARPVDARSDQFSFCVALYEALFGVRPFHGADLEALGKAMEQGPVAAPRGEIPAWLRQAVLKGLSLEPEDRWPSMEPLLERLGRDSGARRKARLKVAGGALAGAMGIGLALHFIAGPADPACARAGENLQVAWNAALVQQGREAFSASPLPYARSVWDHISARVDRYAEDWRRMRRGACEATHVLHEQSEHLLDLRMACLDTRLAALRVLSGRLIRAHPETIERAVELSGKLPPLEACSDAGGLLAPTALPPQKRYRDEIQAAREELAGLELGLQRGDHDRVLDRLQALEERARQAGYPPILAEILLVKTRLLFDLRKLDQAEEACLDGLGAAMAGNHRRYITLCLIEMVRVLGIAEGKGKAYAYSDLARARIQGTGAEEALDLRRLQYLLDTFLYLLEPVDALGLIEAEEERFKAHFGAESLAYGEFLAAKAMSLYYADRSDEAARLYDASLAIMEKELGPGHPRLIPHQRELATLQVRRGQLEPAEAALESARRGLAALGSASRQLRARDAADRGELRSYQGRAEEARAAFDEALQLADGPRVARWVKAYVLLRHAEHLFRHGRWDQAADKGQASLAAYRTAGDRNMMDLMLPRYLLGRVELERNRFDAAREHFQRVVDLVEKRSTEAPAVAYGLVGLAECLLEQGQAEKALPLLERAHRIRQSAPGWYWARPRCAYNLARALHATGGAPDRVRKLARRARDEFGRRTLDLPWDQRFMARLDALLRRP